MVVNIKVYGVNNKRFVTTGQIKDYIRLAKEAFIGVGTNGKE